jgi:peptide deformylase
LFWNKKLEVILVGDPMLREEAKKVSKKEILSKEFQSFLDRMLVAMKNGDGVGLAAPQVGYSSSVFVLDKNLNQYNDDSEQVPQNIFINPEIISTYGNEVAGLEGCLSIPNVFGEVYRSDCVEIQAYDRNGKKFKLNVCGFYSRVIQHEYDHLDGVLFIDRMRDLKTLRMDK